MSRIRRWLRTTVVFLTGLNLISVSGAADWPAYQHDTARSGATEEELSTPLHRRWTFVPPHAPSPAWPEPGRELNRTTFDYAHQAVVAGGRVFFGSSADHKVYALDLKTGQTSWEYFTEGAIRFAPFFDNDRLFVASDDGCGKPPGPFDHHGDLPGTAYDVVIGQQVAVGVDDHSRTLTERGRGRPEQLRDFVVGRVDTDVRGFHPNDSSPHLFRKKL